MLLATNVLSWKQAAWPRVRYFLQVQQRIVFAGVLISALFAVLNPHAPLLFMAFCILTIGNLMMDEVAKFCAGEFRDDVTLLVAAVR
jgi:hypothetical protein